MNRRTKRNLFLATTVLSGLGSSAFSATTGWDKTATGTYDYNATANWAGGIVNGVWDSSLTVAGAQSITFASDTTLSTPVIFNHDGNSAITFVGSGGNRTIILSGNITHNTVGTPTITFGSTTAGINLNVNLGGVVRNFTSASGRSLGFANVISNGGINFSGGTGNFSGVNTYSGATTITSGNFSLNGSSGSVANSDVTVRAPAANASTLTFNASSGSGTTRAKSVTLDGKGVASNTVLGAILSVNGNTSGDSIETITGGITALGGVSAVSVLPNTSRNIQLHAASFSRDDSATVIFRGTNLGLNDLTSLHTPNATASNIKFTTAPTLSGAGPLNSLTAGIIKGAVGDTAALTTSYGIGFVTYDVAKGVRLLNSSEYKTSITNGQTSAENVRLSNSSGSASTTTLNTLTTINSLALNTSALSSPISITGSTLKINSGSIFAQSVSPATTGAEMTISSAIDLNAGQGVILFNTVGSSNGTGGAKLFINGPISNDGGKGIVVSGAGVTEFAGTTPHTYTGDTILNTGTLRFLNSGNAISGNVIVNGGTLQSTSNQIPDDKDITINGGQYLQKSGATNSGSGANETFRDLTVTGGTFVSGATGGDSVTSLRNATLSGGQWSVSNAHAATMSGNISLSGGVINLGIGSAKPGGSVTTGSMDITNTLSSAYTPITLGGSSSTGAAAKIVLGGTLTFTGNTNTNTVTIDAPTATKLGTLALNGTRSFNIGNGSAAVDLTVNALLTNNGATVGGLTKSGLGTALLSAVNTYTGATSITGGTLLVNGSINSATTISNGGTLGGSGSTLGVLAQAGGTISPGNSPGILNTGSVDLVGGGASGASLSIEITGTTVGTEYDQLNVTGTVDLNEGNVGGGFGFNGANLALALTGSYDVGDTFVIIKNNGTDAVTGRFGSINGVAMNHFDPSNNGVSGFDFFTLSGTNFIVYYNYNGDGGTVGNDVVLAVVPEPGSAAFVGLVAAGGLLSRRRRALRGNKQN